MIENPWIILRIDRTRLGAGLWAVREPAREGQPSRRTRDVNRAWRFATRRRAENAIKKLAWGRMQHVPRAPERLEPTVEFVAVCLEEADLPRPKPDPIHHQLALPFVSPEDLELWSLKPRKQRKPATAAPTASPS